MFCFFYRVSTDRYLGLKRLSFHIYQFETFYIYIADKLTTRMCLRYDTIGGGVSYCVVSLIVNAETRLNMCSVQSCSKVVIFSSMCDCSEQQRSLLMCTIRFKSSDQVIIHIEFLPNGMTIISVRYCETIRCLTASVE